MSRCLYTSNGHVPRLLKAGLREPLRDDGYVTPGGEDEAAWYVEDYGFAWLETRGAVPWLAKATERLVP